MRKNREEKLCGLTRERVTTVEPPEEEERVDLRIRGPTFP